MVLAAGVVVFGALAYTAVRRSELAAATARLELVAAQFTNQFGGSFEELIDSAEAAAADPSVIAAVSSREGLDSSAARAALGRLGPVEDAVRAVEIRDAEGGVVLALADSTQAADRGEAVATEAADGVSPLFTIRDSVRVEISAPIRVEGRVVGRVVQSRVLFADPAAVAQVSGIIGADAALLIGNADGSVWTNLVRPVERPPPGAEPIVYARDGEDRFGVSAPIPGTPLHVGTELPRSLVRTVSDAMLRQLALVAVLVVALGTLAGWLVSRRITTPITELSNAAETITRGDLDVSVAPVKGRHDEIVRLADAFNVMAASVREGRDRLGEQVADRTRELRSAMDELREVQDELVRKERLATLGQLSGSVGHELRNPLGVMTNAVYYLEHVLTDVPPKVSEYLTLLRNQIRVSEKIVSDLLDFARVKPPERSPMAVDKLVENQLARVVVPEGITVERDLPEDLPAVDVDPDQIGQVVLNLMTNGLQAMEERGGVLRVSAKADNGRVRVLFRDQGPGVPEEHRDRIFEPLFTTKARGIGLGLSVSRSLARANDGELGLSPDADGSGAVFVLDLPSTGTSS